MARGARVGERGGVAASVANEGKSVGMEGEREETGGAEGFVAAFFANGEGGRTATIVKNEGLVVIFVIFFDGIYELIGKIAIFGEICAIF